MKKILNLKKKLKRKKLENGKKKEKKEE